MKKHVRHMTDKEKNFLISLIRNVQSWKLTDYSFNRVRERNVTRGDVFRAIRDGEIIEYHQKDGEHRILLRGNLLVNNTYEVCVVVAPLRQSVITVYVNEFNDQHRTLKWSAYKKNINVIEEIKGGCNERTEKVHVRHKTWAQEHRRSSQTR